MKEKSFFSRALAGEEHLQEPEYNTLQGKWDSIVPQGEANGGGGYVLRKRAQAARISSINPYDFTQTEKFSSDQWRILNRMAERFAEQLAPKLIPLLHSRVLVEFWELRSLSFREYMDFLPSPTPMAVFQLEDDTRPQISTKGMWVVDILLAFMLLERLMGGRGEPTEEIRELSNIEQAVLKRNLFSKVLETWSDTWKDLGSFNSRLESLEFEPQQIILVPYAEMMVIFAFRMKVGIVEGVWELALPFKFIKSGFPNTTFEDFLSKSSGAKAVEQVSSSIFSKKIEVGKLPVSVEVGRAEIPFQDLLTLEAGDVIRLDALLGSPLKVMVSGRTKFLGKPGLRNNKYAVQITNIVDEGDDNYEE